MQLVNSDPGVLADLFTFTVTRADENGLATVVLFRTDGQVVVEPVSIRANGTGEVAIRGFSSGQAEAAYLILTNGSETTGQRFQVRLSLQGHDYLRPHGQVK